MSEFNNQHAPPRTPRAEIEASLAPALAQMDRSGRHVGDAARHLTPANNEIQ